MKNSLGRIILIFLVFLHVEAFASTYEWSASINKTNAYANEAIHLKYVCSFSDASELYTIEFNPVGDYEKFSLKSLSQNERIVDGKRVNTYEFIAFAKESGKINFDFEMVMKKTTKDSIENTVIGRDNMQREDFVKKFLRQKTLQINVKEAETDLVGEFAVEVKKEALHVKSYQPYHMQITIKGNGDFEEIKPIEFKIEGVKIFTGKIHKDIELTQNGYTGIWNQKFAFVASEDFVIPKIEIKYFDLKKNKIDSLVIDDTKVEVAKGYVKEELLDNIDEQKFKIDYSYIYYFLIFVSGFLLGKVKFKKIKVLKGDDELFKQKIDEVKSLNELMVVLVMKDSKKFEDIIYKIETKELTSLKNAKKMLNLI